MNLRVRRLLLFLRVVWTLESNLLVTCFGFSPLLIQRKNALLRHGPQPRISGTSLSSERMAAWSHRLWSYNSTTTAIDENMINEPTLPELVMWGQSFPADATADIRVPGCVAQVFVRVQIKKDDNDVQRIQHISGRADALVSRGLLCLTAAAVRGQSFASILAIPPTDVATRLGLSSCLSPGRNDGVASLWRTIQEQLLLHEEEPSLVKDDVKSKSKQTGTAYEPTDQNGLDTARRPSVALLLLGGVDSSVALRLLLEHGYDVTAFYLRIWLTDETAHLGTCPWEDDWEMCQKVCTQANVPLEAVSLQEAYHARVVKHALSEAAAGRTPNPDILCNSRIKFDAFYDAVAGRDFDHIATGHYARVEEGRLYRAPDAIKDQSYFLSTLQAGQLNRVLFPLGNYHKHEVREMAQKFDLPNKHRRDSQGLCFLGQVKFDDFLASYLGDRPGELVDVRTGERVGRHRGLWFHTVGQRKGLGHALDPLATSRGPWYVAAKDVARNIVFVSNEYKEDPSLVESRSECTLHDVRWIRPPPVPFPPRWTMKIRHGPKLVSGGVTMTSPSVADVVLDEADGGLAPGQYIALYQGTECIGAGVIGEDHWIRFLSQRSDAAIRNETSVALG